MPVLPVDPTHPDPAIIADAAARVRRGELVAFPTETVYGLGANALDAEAVARIYAAKGRPAWNPVIAHVADRAAAQALARHWPASADRLARAFWPGPLTLVVPKGAHVPSITTAGGDAVAVRVPAHPVALALLQAAGVPIAAPSANRYTQVSPTSARHVVQSLGERVPLVLDGGPCPVGIESTVVDCTGGDVVILRPGMIGREALQAALAGTGVVVREGTAVRLAHEAGPVDEAPRSPGMADRHYAPRGEVWLFGTAQAAEIAAALRARTADAGASTMVAPALAPTVAPVVALLRRTTLAEAETGGRAPLAVIRLPDEPAGYARSLYAALHEADARGASLILIEEPPADDPAWDGVRDRLTRAARSSMFP